MTSTPPARPRRSLSLAQREALWAYVFLAIPIAFYAFIRFWPALQSFYLSLYTWHVDPARRRFVGLGYYRELLENPVFHQALKNTLQYAVITVPASMALGLGIALMLQAVGRGRGAYRAIYFAPYITPAVAVAWVWGWMYNYNYGIINTLLIEWYVFLERFGLERLAIEPQRFLTDPNLALVSVSVVVVWQQLGFQVVIFLAGLQGIPRIYYEAARIDGATPWDLFWHVTLPLLNPVIVFSVVITTINALQLFDQIVNINFTDQGGPLNRTLSIALYMYQEAFGRARLGYAAAVTVVLFAIILIVTLIQLRLTQRRVEY
ncbi:MAG: sugar ABC transporter permease [Trueperaceae bacterium]|nr:sugar ABC transporter permease [Trueperaceae bacterium]